MNEGCHIHGQPQVNKVAGNFHIAPGRSFQQGRVHMHDLIPFGENTSESGHLFPLHRDLVPSSPADCHAPHCPGLVTQRIQHVPHGEQALLWARLPRVDKPPGRRHDAQRCTLLGLQVLPEGCPDVVRRPPREGDQHQPVLCHGARHPDKLLVQRGPPRCLLLLRPEPDQGDVQGAPDPVPALCDERVRHCGGGLHGERHHRWALLPHAQAHQEED
mmetsp:Transcript_3617/g.13099  ORF Transcript_3617/g.13099 Transcript_3617/m.13099 type:complete len:216 (+) Transcript_3617:403-1050(+)